MNVLFIYTLFVCREAVRESPLAARRGGKDSPPATGDLSLNLMHLLLCVGRRFRNLHGVVS
jgi:hypothetical protein